MARHHRVAVALLAGLMAFGAQAAPVAPEARTPITIEIWWHDYAPFTAYVRELIEGYRAVRPDVTVNATVISSAEINRTLAVALAAGTGPDIMDDDASYYLHLQRQGVLEPVNLAVFGVADHAELIARYTPGGLDAATFDGKVYALPYQGNSMSLFINNKAFAAAGLDPTKDAPATWDDVLTLGRRLKIVQDGHTVQKAFDFPYHSARWQVQDFQPLTEQFGGELLSDDGTTAYLDSPAAVKALTLWREVTKAGGDPKTSMNTPRNPNQDFLDGRVAMWITGPWATPQVQQSPMGSNFTVAPMPQVDPAHPHTLVYGWMWGVNKARPEAQKVAAWEFIKYMLARPDQWLAKVGFVQPVAGADLSKAARRFPYYAVHMKDVWTASWYLRSSATDEITQALGHAIDRVVFDGADPKASLSEAQSEAEKALHGK